MQISVATHSCSTSLNMKRRLLGALLVTVCVVAVLSTFMHNLVIVSILWCAWTCFDLLFFIFQVKVMVLLDCGVQETLQSPTPLVECRFITTVSGGTSVISLGTLVQMKLLWSAISWGTLVPVTGARHVMIRKYSWHAYHLLCDCVRAHS